MRSGRPANSLRSDSGTLILRLHLTGAKTPLLIVPQAAGPPDLTVRV